jgi:Asp-tRNA(Asn)/Glu-tRNA(Gln) amidotransferase A subunit family amidase
MDYEGARTHQRRFEEYGLRLGPIADLVRKGRRIPEKRYKQAKESIFRLKQKMAEIFEITPVILTPAATCSAPLGHALTGDPKMNAPWTALGTPAISIPTPVRYGLPLGLQLTSHHGHDATVLQAAVCVEKALHERAAHAWALERVSMGCRDGFRPTSMAAGWIRRLYWTLNRNPL